MQNDVLKNDIAPWQEKGRWIKITCESDQSTWSIIHEESDPFFSNSYIASGNYINLGSSEIESYKYKIIDLKVLLPKLYSGGFNLYGQYFTLYVSNIRQNIVLCPAAQIKGKVVIYAYIYIE